MSATNQNMGKGASVPRDVAAAPSNGLPAVTVAQATVILGHLGDAYRGNWSTVDGRTIRDQMYDAEALIDLAAEGKATAEDITGFYVTWGICPLCSSWEDGCEGEHDRSSMFDGRGVGPESTAPPSPSPPASGPTQTGVSS